MKRQRRLWILACLASSLLAVKGARAQSPPPPAPTSIEVAAPRDVSNILADESTRNDVPALVAAITTSERTVALGASGVRKRGSNSKITLEDKFHLGSCTKSMTATLCALLVAEKKLAWNTKVVEVFKGKVKAIDPGWNEATLEMLLTNSGGAPANLDAGGLWRDLWASKKPARDQRMQLVEGILSRPPEATPGTKFIYSNAGYSLAGAMVEVVLDSAWEKAMTQRLFAPLGIESAGFGAPGTKGKLDQPLGHGATGEPVELGSGDDNPAAIGPAGRVHMSIGDWAKYVRMHLAGERATAASKSLLLAPELFHRLHAKALNDYAMGWSATRREWGGSVLTHNGSNTMWFCVVWISPSKDFAVLVATNQGGDAGAKAADAAAWALIEAHLGSTKGK